MNTECVLAEKTSVLRLVSIGVADFVFIFFAVFIGVIISAESVFFMCDAQTLSAWGGIRVMIFISRGLQELFAIIDAKGLRNTSILRLMSRIVRSDAGVAIEMVAFV